MNIPCQRFELDTVRRIGKRGDTIRPIVVSLTTLGRKIELLRKQKSLETTSVYIKEDFPPEVLQKRKELQEVLKQERDKGKNVAMRYDRIIELKYKK